MSLDSDTTRRAITAVGHPGLDTARRWFELIGEAYGSVAGGVSSPEDVPVAEFRAAFDSRASSVAGDAAVHDFWRFLEENQSQRPMMVVIADLAAPSDLGEVLRIYEDAWPGNALSDVDHGVNGHAVEKDAAALMAEVVARFGADWAAWDGSEETWPQFRDWQYTAADHVDPAWYAAVYEYLDPLNSVSVPDRIAYLAACGFTLTGARAYDGEAPAAAPGDDSYEATDEPAYEAAGEAVDAAVAEQAVHDFVDQAMTSIIDDLPAIAAELEMTEDELRTLIAEQPPEFLAENILAAIDG